ncbi:MAG: proton-conducting transporter membrane subunit, partial [Bacteroidia bacterium]
MSLVSLIPAFPLLGFIINGLFGKHVSKLTSGILGAGSILIAFVLALICFINQHPGQANEVILFPWIQSGSMDIHVGLLMDPLSILFTLIITGIGFLIHVYSMAYMHTDEGFSRFFTYLNLFVFFMLLLVLGNSLVLTFVGWEGVGLCSYLLIGFWFTNSNYNAAARKAFVMNRIGDLGFLLGIMLVWVSFGRLDYAYITTHPGLAGTDVITGIA